MRIACAALAAVLAACTVRTADAPPPARPAETAAVGVIDIAGALVQGGFARGTVPAGTTRLALSGADVPIAPDGGFFIAFARDAPGTVELVATGAGEPVVRRLDISPRRFPEERLPARLAAFAAEPGFERRRAAELAGIAAARSVVSSETGWRAAWLLPAAGRVSGVFGSQRFYGDEPQSPHSGLDIAAPPGTPVAAPAPGVVVLASPPEFSLEGNLVIIDHGLGLFSSYLHLSRIAVAVGDRLRQGEIIGAVGASGRVTGAHLHWGVMWQGVRFDPAILTEALTVAVAPQQ